MPQTVFNTSAAVAAGDNQLLLDRNLPCTLHAVGLGAGETVDLYISSDGGVTWQVLYEGGAAKQLTQTATHYSVTTPVRLSFVKVATTGAVRLSVMRHGDV